MGHNHLVAQHRSTLPWSCGLALALLLLPVTSQAQSFQGMQVSEMLGCFALSANGKRMACVDLDNGAVAVEVKDIRTRRLHKVFPLGAPKAPGDIAATPPKTLKRMQKWLTRKKFRRIATSSPLPDGSFPVPHTGCALILPDGTTGFVRTVTADATRPWLMTGGFGGPEALLAVSSDPQTNQLFLVIAMTTRSGDATVRDFQVVKLSDLTSRLGCEAPPNKPESKTELAPKAL